MVGLADRAEDHPWRLSGGHAAAGAAGPCTRPVLRFEAIVHNTKALRVGHTLERFPDIVTQLGAMVDRFCTVLDCVDVGFIPDGTLDPLASKIGATRVGGIDLNRPRMRAAMAAFLAGAARRRPHDDGPSRPTRPGHRPDPRRMPGSEARAQTQHLDRP